MSSANRPKCWEKLGRYDSSVESEAPTGTRTWTSKCNLRRSFEIRSQRSTGDYHGQINNEHIVSRGIEVVSERTNIPNPSAFLSR